MHTTEPHYLYSSFSFLRLHEEEDTHPWPLSVMPSRDATIPQEPIRSASQRWSLSSAVRLVDADTPPSAWGLTDDLVRLQISDVAKDVDQLHRSIRTPPKSKLTSAVNENSPLDASPNTSIGSSPHTPDHLNHSRGSSTDTTTSHSQDSPPGTTATLLNHTLKVSTIEPKERPHSFSGGLSNADLRRLRQIDNDEVDAQQWISNQLRDNGEQSQLPSLSQLHRPQPISPPQLLNNYRSAAHLSSDRDDSQIDYNLSQTYSTIPQSLPMASLPPQYVAGRLNNVVNIPNVAYRQAPRIFPQQTIIPTANPLSFPVGLHASHLSLGNTQQLYDMMIPQAPHDSHPAVARVQQQHNVFRGHHHSASDPSAMRDATTLSLLNNSFAHGLYTPPLHPSMPMFPNQYYNTQELLAASQMSGRIPTQFTGPYNLPSQQNVNIEPPMGSPTLSASGQSGPSANNRKLGLYKTELCRSWEEKGTCRYGTKCQFAHGEEELRRVSRHPKYKTEICRTFWVSGSCPYGKRCCFIHTELPSNGSPATPGSENPPEARPRSMSTNSDPNDSSVSLLARISAKRNESNGLMTPVELNKGGFQFDRPPSGKLRVNTAVPSLKQNKSAYPSFTSNGILLPAAEQTPIQEPAPVTAGPDLGRHNNARREIVGFNNSGHKRTSSSNIRHSIAGIEGDLNLSSLSNGSGHNYSISSGGGESTPVSTPRASGHTRSGSAGNWASFSRSGLANSSYPDASSATADRMTSSPWNELSVSALLNEKAWA